MKFFTSFFKTKSGGPETRYAGFSDFLLRASQAEKIAVFKEVAHKANEEQRKVVEGAQRTQLAN